MVRTATQVMWSAAALGGQWRVAALGSGGLDNSQDKNYRLTEPTDL